MKFVSLSFLKKTGAFLIRTSVFAFLLITPLKAQQLEGFSEDGVTKQNEKPADVRVLPKKITFGAGAQNVQKKPVAEKHETYRSDNGKIEIYMQDFKISQGLSGILSCMMKVYVRSTLATPVSNISFRLKWPELEAPLSFDNIEPERAVFQVHAFAGKLCYTLDRTPNIIVNRCRVKGMSQQECAGHIEWVK